MALGQWHGWLGVSGLLCVVVDVCDVVCVCGCCWLACLLARPQERIRSGRAPDGTRLTENPHDELRAMQYLSDPGCPNLLTLIEVIHNAEYLIAVLEYAPGGELFDVVTTAPNGRFTEDVAKYYFKQLMTGTCSMLQALPSIVSVIVAVVSCGDTASHRRPCSCTATAYMHTLGVAHRDMSLENMLVATGNVGKVIDFGLCVELPRTALGRFAPLPPAGAVGKIFYMAPEVRGDGAGMGGWWVVFCVCCPPFFGLWCGEVFVCGWVWGVGSRLPPVCGGQVFRGNVPYWGHLADVWSCGVMLFIMLTGGMSGWFGWRLFGILGVWCCATLCSRSSPSLPWVFVFLSPGVQVPLRTTG